MLSSTNPTKRLWLAAISFGCCFLALGALAQMSPTATPAAAEQTDKAVAEEAPDAEPVACFKQVTGSACDQFQDLSPECPDSIIASAVCNSVQFSEIGFSSSTSYSATCKMLVSVPNEEGGCDDSVEESEARCKDAEGTACKVKKVK